MHINKRLLLILLIIILIVICFMLYVKKNIDFVKYEEELLNINLSDYVISSTGKINYKEEYATIKFEIDSNLINEFEKLLNLNFETLNDEFMPTFYQTQLYNTIIEDTANKEILEIYHVFISGKKVMTRDTYLVLCEENNRYYLFIYG